VLVARWCRNCTSATRADTALGRVARAMEMPAGAAKAGPASGAARTLHFANSRTSAPALPRRTGASVAADLVPAQDEGEAPAGTRLAPVPHPQSSRTSTQSLPFCGSCGCGSRLSASRDSRNMTRSSNWPLRASCWTAPTPCPWQGAASSRLAQVPPVSRTNCASVRGALPVTARTSSVTRSS
jgi:hypothetical protein